jgi:hypothetical protein
MHTTPLFFHGREGSNRGNKARWLAREYGACTPTYDTESLDAAMPRARRVLKQHGPSVVVGSSFGGAVLLKLIQEGLWDGPSVFLAQAGVKFGLEATLPTHVPAVVVHGTRDTIVDPQDSRALAESSGAQLVEVDDDHRLGSIRASGVLGGALQSLGIRPLLYRSDDVLPFEERAEILDWLEAVISPNTTLEQRRELGAWKHRSRRLESVLVAALWGLWRHPKNAEEVEARRSIFELFSNSMVQAPYNLEVRAVDDAGELHVGTIKTTYGTSLYDFHYEWPIDGMGVRKDLIEVFPPDGGPAVPILDWLRKEGRVIFCYRCGGILSDRVERGCPGRGL